MTDSRLEKLQYWLSNTLELSYSRIEVASADASFRRYFRVFLDEQANQNSSVPAVVIAMDSPPEHEDNNLFIQCTNILNKPGVNVPIIYHSNINDGFLLLTDLGSQTYQDALENKTADTLYKKAVDALHQIQRHCDASNIASYDKAKLDSEMDLFDDWYIHEYHKSELSDQELRDFNNVKSLLTSSALAQPQTLVHRDYHCRNLLVCEEQNLATPGIIDYQDMLLGPATYDLASLFKDCYIQWPENKVQEWVVNFKNNYEHSFDLTVISDEQWLKWFDFMGVQRHLKVLGIFCRLHFRDGKNQYMNDLPLTYKYLVAACEKHPELEPLLKILLKHPVKQAH